MSALICVHMHPHQRVQDANYSSSKGQNQTAQVLSLTAASWMLLFDIHCIGVSVGTDSQSNVMLSSTVFSNWWCLRQTCCDVLCLHVSGPRHYYAESEAAGDAFCWLQGDLAGWWGISPPDRR